MKRGFFIIAVLSLMTMHEAFSSELAYSKSWLSLLHYQRNGAGYESSIDSPDFFLSANGRNDPQAELNAAIDLFANSQDLAKICLFPARYLFLARRGLIKKQTFDCQEFAQFKKDLAPSGTTLLFTDAYMSNPSSLFGHTLLRIDTNRRGTQLLAHGANYGAFTDGEENSVLFAVLGLTGGYYGGWTVKPYYDIINTYNNIENRDIWEFNLDFNTEELEILTAHLWEIGHTQTKYYFFSKNCSYMLMEFLDAIRPSLELAEKFPAQTIPIDTLKAVVESGLVKSVNYRPSRHTKIIHRVEQMNRAQYTALIRAVKDEDYSLSGLKEEEKPDVLETAYQYVQYQFIKKDLDLQEYRRRSFKGLRARSGLTEQKSLLNEIPKGVSPIRAHDSMRFTIGAGRKNHQNFQEISYRPAYHSLSDNPHGFLDGAEINFLNAKIRHYEKSRKTLLSEFNILSIKSLTPIDEMFTPPSYSINLDIKRAVNPHSSNEGYIMEGKIAGGGSLNILPFWLAYTKAGVGAAYGGFLEHNQYENIDFIAGSYVNLRYFMLLSEIRRSFATNKNYHKTSFALEGNIALSRNWGLAAEYKLDDYRKNITNREFVISIRRYFGSI